MYPKTRRENNKKFHSLTFLGPISNKISNTLTTDTISIAFESSNRLSNLLFNVKDKQNKYKKSGVYKLQCNECNSCYVGQTGRNFEIRYKEQETCFRLNKRSSKFTNHFLDSNHTFQISPILYSEKRVNNLFC